MRPPATRCGISLRWMNCRCPPSRPRGATARRDEAAATACPVVAGHEVQAHVQPGRGASRGDDLPLVHKQNVRIDRDRGVKACEVVGRQPMGCRAPPVEQAREGEDEGARADRGDPRAAIGGALQGLDRHDGHRRRRIGAARRLRARNDDRVSLVQTVERPLDVNIKGPCAQPSGLAADADLVGFRAVPEADALEQVAGDAEVERHDIVQGHDADDMHRSVSLHAKRRTGVSVGRIIPVFVPIATARQRVRLYVRDDFTPGDPVMTDLSSTDDRPPPLRTAMLVYPGMTLLDLAGPQLALGMHGETYLAWKDRDPVRCDSGMTILPTHTFEECPGDLDVLFVPGGMNTAQWMDDETVLTFLRKKAGEARFVTSVCSGALILAAAGLLDGVRAATHWRAYDALEALGAQASRERVTVDGNRITGGGVTAGLDFSLTLLARLRGETVARMTQLGMEYDPAPPFDSGTPERAGPQLVAAFTAMTGEVDTETAAVIERVLNARAA